MEDVTEFVLLYREAARHVWNCFLRGEPFNDHLVHDWEAIKQVLFTALVLRNCGYDECAPALLSPERYGFSWIKPIMNLHVVPKHNIPIMITKEPGPHSRSWNHPLNRVEPNDLDMRFIDFFDWDETAPRDFRFYQVGIEGSKKYPDLIGHLAMLEVHDAKVWAESEEASPGTAGR